MKTEAIIFACGTVLGAIGGFMAAKSKYESEAKEKEKDLREHYEEKLKKLKWENIKNDAKGDSKKSPDEDAEKPKYSADKGSINKYYSAIHKSGYVSPNVPIRNTKPSEDTAKEQPRIEIIPPNELGLEDDFEEISLVYYAGNDILEDDYGEIVDNREDVVGEDFVKHFGEFEKGTVIVINRAHEAYYVIELDEGKYNIESRPTRIKV